jgi:hypothetical protein
MFPWVSRASCLRTITGCTCTPVSGYNKHHLAASICRGVFVSAIWGSFRRPLPFVVVSCLTDETADLGSL